LRRHYVDTCIALFTVEWCVYPQFEGVKLGLNYARHSWKTASISLDRALHADYLLCPGFCEVLIINMDDAIVLETHTHGLKHTERTTSIQAHPEYSYGWVGHQITTADYCKRSRLLGVCQPY